MKAKNSAILFLLLFPFFSIAQSSRLEGKILWDQGRQLKWDDFKGNPDAASPFYALTNSGVYYEVQQTALDQYKVTLVTYFDPGGSWCKKDLVTDSLLVHEQHHFDTHELFARLIIKRLQEMDFQPGENVMSRMRETYMDTMNESERFSDQYDKETLHSKNTAMQTKWNIKIDSMLVATEKYNLNEITLTIK